MNEVLVAEDLKKSYRDGVRELHVLKGINIEVRKGEMLVIKGPSGAGKSTLLHLLGALDKPTNGKVYLDGTDIYKLPDRKLAALRNKRIGFVFQFYHLLPEFSVIENVMFPALVGGEGRQASKRALQLLEKVGLDERMHHYPSELSGGEMQRVAIARALINSPEIVFADEPTGNLDSDNSKSVLNLMRQLNEEEQQTFVLATHDNSLAREVKRVMTIVDGVLREGDNGTKNIS